jgi:hypothetical protein
VGIGKALGHPTRLAILRDLRSNAETRSPTTCAEANGMALANIHYHFQTLAGLGVVSLSRTEKRRGATEHFYFLDGPLTVAVLTTLDLLEGRTETIAPDPADRPLDDAAAGSPLDGPGRGGGSA